MDLGRPASIDARVYAPEVWILEDEPDFAEILVDSVSDISAVKTFDETSSPLNQILKGATPDVLVVDWVLKGSMGLDFLQQVRRENRSVPVIMMSGADEVSMVFNASRAGIDCFLLKPFDFGVFRKHVSVGVLRSRFNKINDHLVRVLGDLILGLELNQGPHAAKSQEAIRTLKLEAEWLLKFREQTAKEIAGVDIN